MLIDSLIEFITRNVKMRGRVKLVKFLKPLLSEQVIREIRINNNNNFRMKLSPWDNIPSFYLRFFGFWEKDETRFLVNNLKQGDVVFDIGANVGYFSLLASRCVGNNGIVHCFEPVSKTFEVLKENISLNSFNNIIVNNVALSDTVGNCNMYIHPEDSGSNSMGRYTSNESSVTVKTNTIDNYLLQNENIRIDLIKIDVEGAEVKVFDGAKNLLKSSEAPTLLLEINPKRLSALNSSDLELQQMLSDFGYKIYKLESDRMTELSPFISHEKDFYTVVAKKC